MKMPDGGFRPAYNVQFATTTEGGVIVGVDVTNEGTDGGQMPPMLDQIEERFARIGRHLDANPVRQHFRAASHSGAVAT